MARKQFSPEQVFSSEVGYNGIIPKVLNSPRIFYGQVNSLLTVS